MPKALVAFVLGWLGGYLHGVAVGERDRVDRDPGPERSWRIGGTGPSTG